MLLLAAVAGALIFHSARLPAATPDPASAPPAVPVTVAAAVRADVPVRLSALGSVVVFNTVTVRPRVDGQLMSVTFRYQYTLQGDDLASLNKMDAAAGGSSARGAARR